MSWNGVKQFHAHLHHVHRQRQGHFLQSPSSMTCAVANNNLQERKPKMHDNKSVIPKG